MNCSKCFFYKKRQALPTCNPSDSQFGALSVGPGVVNQWSVRDVFYGIALNCLCFTENNYHQRLFTSYIKFKYVIVIPWVVRLYVEVIHEL